VKLPLNIGDVMILPKGQLHTIVSLEESLLRVGDIVPRKAVVAAICLTGSRASNSDNVEKMELGCFLGVFH
jgi:hypothetical protein